MLPTLTPCPHCGVKLAPNLIARIIDPRADESCPKPKWLLRALSAIPIAD